MHDRTKNKRRDQCAGQSTITNGRSDIIQEAQDALWLVEENISKLQNQKKKRASNCCGQRVESPEIRELEIRHERELCLNNVNLSNNKCRSSKINLRDQTYCKKSRDEFLKRSFENVSRNSFYKHETELSTLRRSQSLAISREITFKDLNVGKSSHYRQQLIPRAKLIDRNIVKERYFSKEREICQNVEKGRSTTFPNYSLRHSQNSDPELCRQNDNFDLSLPNFHPASDIILTDLSLEKYSHNDDSKQSKQLKNNFLPECTTGIFYHDNVSFGKKFKENYLKPRTIREYTPFTNDIDNLYDGKPRSLPNFSLNFDDTSNLYDTTIETKIYEELDEIFKCEEIKNASDFSQSDLNFDEINLYNDNITKTNALNNFCCESNPIYDEITTNTNEVIKTNVESKINDSDEFKTIVIVEEQKNKEPRQHEHKYLKEFIESQKGSKRPLQNFLRKKISRAFSENKIKENFTNQYHSLPDLSIGKNLQHCDRIDRNLRNCENSNRFIVNIGKHFDVTAESNIPVDFEVKISKIPKLKRIKSVKKEQCFIDAVKNLNNTLDRLPYQINDNFKTSGNISSSAAIIECTKYNNPKEGYVVENINEKLKLPGIQEVVEMEPEASQEYQEKLDTIRNYWGKIAENQNLNENKEVPNCKIIDVKTKVEDVIKKFENIEEKDVEKHESIVKIAKKVFEVNEKPEKNFPIRKKLDIFEQKNQFESLNPCTVDIIEKKPPVIVNSSNNSIKTDFDHIRYKVMKSDLFQKNIFANCQKESQFDGLMQYLQHYSFQELLIDNNIVIIEPIRTNVVHEVSSNGKTTNNVKRMLQKSNYSSESKESGLRKHFFYHPIRVNKEMNENELPNPDTVKLVRQLFENGLKKSQSSQDLDKASNKSKKTIQYETIESGENKCSDSCLSDLNTRKSCKTAYRDNNLLNNQYVSEDVLKKIRECGTSITYYGGRILNKKRIALANPITEAIMNEIKENRECKCDQIRNSKHSYNGIKFKLLKSNSCSSRLELVGTDIFKQAKQKHSNQEKHLLNDKYFENLTNKSCTGEKDKKEANGETNVNKQFKQWSITDIKTYNNITINKEIKKSSYNYHNYDKLALNSKKVADMEFEPYEIAG